MVPSIWKVTCEERWYPGLWPRWFRAQSVAVGWPPQDGYHLRGRTKGHRGWARARNSLLAIKPGDRILVALHGNRLRRYMQRLKRELRKEPRGILVHGGAQKLRDDVRAAAGEHPSIQLVQHRVDVDFAPSV